MKKEIKFLIFLFILAFIIRFVFVFSTPIKIWDETVYSNLAYDLSTNPLDYSLRESGWSDFIPSSDANYAWPKMGFRAPLLPLFLMFFYLFNLNFLISFFIPLIGSLSCVLVYFLGKELFNKKVAEYSSLLLAVTPLHVVYSAKILTGILFTFFILLTFFSFWRGYEKEEKKHKILFGVFLALALLSRYTALWIAPVFLFYFLIRDKSLKFVKDKYLWYSIMAFFIILIPWFLYGFFEYGNIFGAFIHGAKASGYWGGLQSGMFFFYNWWHMFSIIGVVFILSLVYVFSRKEFMKKEVYFFLIWFAFFLVMAIYMPHKEDRFILVITPPLVLLSGYVITKIKNYQKTFLSLILLISFYSLGVQFNYTFENSYTDTNVCFLEANQFLNNLKNNSVVVTDESSVVFYYTHLETRFYPNPWKIGLIELWSKGYSGRDTYLLFGSHVGKSEEEFILIKKSLEENFDKIFECNQEEGFSSVYKV